VTYATGLAPSATVAVCETPDWSVQPNPDLVAGVGTGERGTDVRRRGDAATVQAGDDVTGL
jgi:hypothetical protein